MQCTGTETSLADCGHDDWGVSNCHFSERAGVRCEEGTAATDATLSALALADAADDSAITLDQTFASATTTYTASVANGVTRVTVTPTASDAEAIVEYLDASDAALTDADDTKDGFQVDLGVGDTVIKVKVTAEDNSTTSTYQVTVTRAAVAGCTDPKAIWCATLTVGEDQIGALTLAFGFVDLASDVGALSDTVFTFGGTSYAIKGITIDTEANPGLYLKFNPSGETVFNNSALTLHIGTDMFSLEDATYQPMNAFFAFDDAFKWTNSGLSWSVGDMIAVKLTDSSIANTDATLSDLTLADSSDDSPITLDQTFASDTTSYTASVANSVTRATVTPTVNDSNASVEYLDGSDAALTDADDTKDGFQADLGVGDTVIKVKVTAEDTTTTETYQVTVTRAAQASTTVWSATLSVKNLVSGILGCSNSVQNNHCSTSSILSDDDFMYGGTNHVVEVVLVRPQRKARFRTDNCLRRWFRGSDTGGGHYPRSPSPTRRTKLHWTV